MNTALVEYGRVLRARWRWIVWGVLLALGATTCFLLVQPPLYRSDATVFVRTPGDISRVRDGGDSYAQASAPRLTSVLARSTERVGTCHRGPRPRHQARGPVTSASTRPTLRGTALIDVSVSAPSAVEARSAPRPCLLSEYRCDGARIGVGSRFAGPTGRTRGRRPARSRRSAWSAWGAPVWTRLVGAHVLIGLVLGATAAVLRSIFDGSVRDPRDASRLSGRQLLGSIGGEPSGQRTDR